MSARLFWLLPARLHDLFCDLSGWRVVCYGRQGGAGPTFGHHWSRWR